MAALALLGVAAALAWQPATDADGVAWVALHPTGPPARIALARWAGRDVVIAGGARGLELFDPASGDPLGRLDRRVADLAVHDLDGDGEPELLVCGPAGIEVVRPGWPLSDPSLVLWAHPCGALEVTGTPAVFVVASEGRTLRLEPSPAGLRGRPADAHALAPRPVAADVAGGHLTGDPRAATLVFLGPAGPRTFDTGAPVAALAAADLDGDGCEEVAIGAADRPVLAVARGDCRTPVPARPVRIAAADPGPTYDESLPAVLREARCDLDVGVAVGRWTSDRDPTVDWTAVGADLAFVDGLAGGALVALGCSGGPGALRWTGALQSVPGLRFGAGEARRAAWAMAVLGAEWSPGPAFAAGPVVEAGVPWWLAAGGRIRWSPFRTGHDSRVGLEVRGLYVPGEAHGAYGTLAVAYGLGRRRVLDREAW